MFSIFSYIMSRVTHSEPGLPMEKVAMQRTQQFSGFLCYRKNPVKCNACAFARKIETDCFSRNMPISNDPVVRISRNLAEK